MSGQLIDLWGTDEPCDFFCPACGAILLGPSGYAKNPCKHLAFYWINEVGTLDHLSPALKDVLDMDWPKPYDEEFLALLPDRTLVFMFSATPPNAFTVVAAVTFPKRE